jgi:hypothetical protein
MKEFSIIGNKDVIFKENCVQIIFKIGRKYVPINCSLGSYGSNQDSNPPSFKNH